MKCVICKNGDLVDGKTSVLLERDGATLAFKDVPARVCENCGEDYVAEDVNDSLLQRAEEDFEDLKALRAAIAEDGDTPTVSLDAVKKELGL